MSIVEQVEKALLDELGMMHTFPAIGGADARQRVRMPTAGLASRRLDHMPS